MSPFDMRSLSTLRGLEKRHFPYPNSLDPLTPNVRTGLYPITALAMMSLLSVTLLLGFITHRLLSWRQHYRQYVGYNQYVILIYNLLLADLQQAIAFSISIHWLREDAIMAPTAACFMQGWFLNIGDVSSGFFVLAIAIHTWLGVVKGYKMPYFWFVVSIVLIWLLALFLTLLGPSMYKDHFFTRAGGWCWITIDHQPERLWLHYIWVFIDEFGTILIYGSVFVHLRGRIRSVMNNDTTKLTRATKFMVMYPLAYVVLTLPLAVARMIAMTGYPVSDTLYMIAGCLLTSCGWVDALLYTLTRRVLVTTDFSSGYRSRTAVSATKPSAVRTGDSHSYGLSSLSGKDGNPSTARTVTTIVGGSKKFSRIVDHTRGRNPTRSKHHESILDDSPTRSGSQDSIVKPMPLTSGIEVVTETNIHVETAAGEHCDSRPQTQDWIEASPKHS